MTNKNVGGLLGQLDTLNESQLRRLLVEHLTQQKLGLTWEANDRWRHSQWLEFLYRRLSLARDLLTPDGVIMVSINDENRSRLELLMDEVMPGRRLGSLVWRTRQGSNADQQCFLSVDHEHVLVYGNPDNDPRGDWRTSDLTLGYSYKARPNLYYPLLDPKTGVAYPSNPDRVWVYASERRLKEGQTVQAKTMEEFMALGQIIFPAAEQRVETWPTMDALLAAIDAVDVPKIGKNPVLRRDLPNLEFWVGRPVGFGRPRFKRYKADLRNQTQPLSSWVVPNSEVGDYEAEGSFVADQEPAATSDAPRRHRARFLCRQIEANCYSLLNAVMRGQVGGGANE